MKSYFELILQLQQITAGEYAVLLSEKFMFPILKQRFYRAAKASALPTEC